MTNLIIVLLFILRPDKQNRRYFVFYNSQHNFDKIDLIRGDWKVFDYFLVIIGNMLSIRFIL